MCLVMNREFYNLNEAIEILKRNGITTDIGIISNYVRERIIHPIIYIDSFPVHVCELRSDGQGVAIGLCLLSAYWSIGDDIVAVFDGILREEIVTMGYVVKRDNLIKERLTAWDSRPHVFDGVPLTNINPKDYSKDLAIFGFIFLKEKPFKITIKNIFITYTDLIFLNKELSSKEKIILNTSPNLQKSLQHQRTQMIIETIDKIILIAKGKKILIDKEHMPGTKNEFISLLVTINNSLRNISDSTLKDYLKRIGIKFKAGVKANSQEFIELQAAIKSNIIE